MNMRTRIILLALAVVMAAVLPAAIHAADPAPATFEKITVGATAVAISDSTLNPTSQPQRRYCLFTLETAEVRWRADGTSPDSTTGHVLSAGQSFDLSGIRNLTRARFIRTTGSSGTLSVSCW
jgi:hypothetical protein